MTYTRRHWAKRLNAIWREAAGNMLRASFALGEELIKAKEGLPHGEFIKMVSEDLEFSRSTGARIMAVARDKRLRNVAHVRHLPPSWGTLYLLSRLDDRTFNSLIEDGTIRPDLQRHEVARIVRVQEALADERRVLTLRPITGKFRTLVLDPAWKYDDSLAGRARPGYAPQTLEELLALDVKAWADDAGCHLYLWVTNAFVGHGCELM